MADPYCVAAQVLGAAAEVTTPSPTCQTACAAGWGSTRPHRARLVLQIAEEVFHPVLR